MTGRSLRGNQTAQWPEVASEDTKQDTAEQVTKGGGVGIPVQCDHNVDEQVEALFDRVKQEQGRLDILVNNAWGGYRDVDETWENSFWEQPFWPWDVMFRVGVWSN